MPISNTRALPPPTTHPTSIAALDTYQRQVGMAHVMQRVSAEGTPLRVFAGVSARRGGRATIPRELKRGGRYPLPANARVVSRFR